MKDLVKDCVVSVVAGYAGTKVMAPVSMKLHEMESDEARHREDEVRPGPPYEIAARKTVERLGLQLTDAQIKTLAKVVFHYGLGASWVPVYLLLRRKLQMSPVGAGLTSGAAMSLIIDEGMTPVLGFSAPNRAYPTVTHLRGFVAHLAYGLGVAVTAEALNRVLRR